MKKIQELLDAKKDKTVHHIGPDATVFEAVTRMVDLRVGALLVMTGDEVSGIVTERDYLRFITVKGRTSRDTPVRDIMTDKVIFVSPDVRLDEVMGIMTSARIRHMPIMNESGLCGIVSIGDVVKAISQEQEVHIRALEEYIYDPYPGKGTS